MRKVKQKYGSHFDCIEFIMWCAFLSSNAESEVRCFLFNYVL